MNEYSVESFLDYCDNLDITEEGWLKDHKTYRQEKKVLKEEKIAGRLREEVIHALDAAKIPYKKVGRVRFKKEKWDSNGKLCGASVYVKVFIEEEYCMKAEDVALKALEKITQFKDIRGRYEPEHGAGYNKKNFPGYIMAILTIHDKENSNLD